MKTIIAIVAAMFITACATNPQLPTQYATLKLIESERVSADDVIERVERVRVLIDMNVAISMSEIESAIDWQSLAPSDRLLVAALIGDLDAEFQSPEPFSEEVREAILERLEWIAQAAAMAE